MNLTVFLSLLAAVTEQIFKIGSMEPGAMLFEATKEFQVGRESSKLCNVIILSVASKALVAQEQCACLIYTAQIYSWKSHMSFISV